MWVDTGSERYSAKVLLTFSLDCDATGRDPWYVQVPQARAREPSVCLAPSVRAAPNLPACYGVRR